ncbi:MAG: Wzy polymerase domain-containing protein [Sulfuritalea sp.]|nr:Wzy polymerase domain-containing protein [Sulfuritalea sp.]MDP1983889.1 Wzy polymerase domain-containing protein [Sulfuritalea sp.]
MGLSINAERLAGAYRKTARITLFQDVNLAALLLFCALLFPFILSYHRNPIPSFYQEWVAIFLALAAAILVAARYRGERFDFPFSVWIPLALMPSVAIHLVAGNALIVHGPPLHMIYIGSAALLMIIGRKLCSAREAISLADVMAAAFVAGALASCVASWHWRFQTSVFDPLPWAPDMGWIGQRNQNGLHIWLGILGISHFLLNRKVSWFYFLVCVEILTETSIYTHSRSVYLYAGCGLALGVWAAAKSPARDVRKRLLLIGMFPAIFLGAILGTRLLLDLGDGSLGDDSRGNSGAIQRYAPATVIQDPRLGLWYAAAKIALTNPWIGAGPGSYIRESWVISDSLPSTVPNAVPSGHAHNLFLQIGAELGAVTALALAGFIGVWFFFALQQSNWQRNWLYVAIPLAVLAHNQVEFSLWYLYFLVPTALSMGAPSMRLAGKGVPALVVLISAVLGLGLAARLGQDYQSLEDELVKADDADLGALLSAAKHPIFGAWASAQIASYPSFHGITPQRQNWHATRALFVLPLPKPALLRHTDALEREGKSAEAAVEQRVTRRVFGN